MAHASAARSTGRLLLVIVSFLALPAPAHSDVILHAFDWTYSEIAAAASQIAAAGYRAVLVAMAI